jgi:tetratricopeptide (TPR) repeat protein
VLRKAAEALYPEPGEGRRPFLERGLALLARRPAALSAAEWHLKASSHRELGQAAEALTAYQAALRRQPRRLDWRYELAELLYDQGRFGEARQELLTILALQPGHEKAPKLLEVVTRKVAETM